MIITPMPLSIITPISWNLIYAIRAVRLSSPSLNFTDVSLPVPLFGSYLETISPSPAGYTIHRISSNNDAYANEY
jgi:hypothetical protein